MWTEGWAYRNRATGQICTRAEVRSELERRISNRELLQWYSRELDEISEDCPPMQFSLKQLGYLKCRDEIIDSPLWDEIDSETKCYMLTMDDWDIDQWVGAILDGVMCEYDETGWNEMP